MLENGWVGAIWEAVIPMEFTEPDGASAISDPVDGRWLIDAFIEEDAAEALAA